VRDPRAEVLSSAAESFYQADGDSEFFDLAKTVEDEAVDLLEEYKPGRRLDTNVEFYTAVLLHGIGIPDELFTTTFAIARTGGWTAHCLEQLENNRLMRPRGKYVGEKDRSWTPVAER
jgi:citrate synthase